MNTRITTSNINVSCFDFICVSLYFGLPFWICMSCLNLRVSQISCCPLICSTNSYEHEMSYSTFNVSCFWFHTPFPLLWFTDLDVYVFFESTLFSNLSLSIRFPSIPMNMRFPTPPSMCCVFDFLCVSLYFGLQIWICMSFLNRRFSQISCCPFICSINSYEHEISHSTFNVLCLLCCMCISLYFGLQIWICMSFFNRRFSQISCCPFIFSINVYEHEMSHSTFNVLCFWFHMCVPRLWLTDLDLYVCFESMICFKSIGWFRFGCEIRDGSLSNF